MKATTFGSLAIVIVLAAGCAQVFPTHKTAKPRAGRYGAIAYSPVSQNWRYRWNVVSQSRAVALALRDCGDDGCQTVLVFGPRQCGAFALSADNPHPALGVGRGATKDEAQQAALAACRAKGKGCKVAPAQCNR